MLNINNLNPCLFMPPEYDTLKEIPITTKELKYTIQSSDNYITNQMKKYTTKVKVSMKNRSTSSIKNSFDNIPIPYLDIKEHENDNLNIIFLHANAEDIFQVKYKCKKIAHFLKVKKIS